MQKRNLWLILLNIGLLFLISYLDKSRLVSVEDPELLVLIKKVKALPTKDHLEQLNVKIRAIWTHKCFSCHSSEKMKADLALDTYEGVMAGGKDGEILIIGNSAQSDIIRRLKLPQGHHDAMPSKGVPLSQLQIKAIALWIDHGAVWADSTIKLFYEAPLKLSKPDLPPTSPGITHPIDRIVQDYFKSLNIKKWPKLIDDHQFIRKVYLDITGLLPTPAEVEVFLSNSNPNKRSELITNLLNRNEAYTLHWMSFWNDLLRNDYSGTGFITEGRKQISEWIYQSLLKDSSYTTMVQSLINPSPQSEGFIKGIAWRGEVNSSQSLEMQAAQNVSQSLLGMNLKCASCHNSFVNNISLEESYGFASIFASKPLQMHRCDAPTGKYIQPKFIYSELGQIKSDSLKERLAELASFITKPENGRLYRTIVNRIWHQLFGRGIIGTLDDLDQKAWSPILLDYISAEFRDQGTSLKALLTLILTSKTYQLPSVDYGSEESLIKNTFLFKGPSYRKLHAEQIADAISQCIYPMYDGVSFDPENRKLPAFWIWHHQKKFDRTVLPNPGKIYLRKSFNLKNRNAIRSAKLIATGSNALIVHINGNEIHNSNDIRKFNPIDILEQLKSGQNTLAIEAMNDGFIAKPAGVLLHARLIDNLGDTSHIYSDKSWSSTDSLTSGWKGINFNDSPWYKAHSYSSFQQSPWGKLLKFNIDGINHEKLIRSSLVKADPFLLALGRPTRENVTTKRSEEPGLLQSISLMNHPLLHYRIQDGAKHWHEKFKSKPNELIHELYLSLLNRPPSFKESKILLQYLHPVDRSNIEEIMWSIIVSPEFQFL